MTEEVLVPAAEAAARLGITRERLVRRIQDKNFPEWCGENRDGKWYMSLSAITHLTSAPEIFNTIRSVVQEEHAEQKADAQARGDRLKTMADERLHGQPIPDSLARLTALRLPRKKND